MKSFECKFCGHCCEGVGGIIVSLDDLVRICEHLELSPEVFEAQWGERVQNKLRIRSGDSGYCVFFEENVGCGIHEVKPSVCQAWPFFRGNLIDSVSLELAKEYCPGIEKNISFEEFALEGMAYLTEKRLCASGKNTEPNALQVADIITTRD